MENLQDQKTLITDEELKEYLILKERRERKCAYLRQWKKDNRERNNAYQREYHRRARERKRAEGLKNEQQNN